MVLGLIFLKYISDIVDCMVALPGQLFYSTQIRVCLWFLTKSKKADAKRGFRDRRKHTLFIDARKLGTLIDRVHRELLEPDLQNITSTYHAWRSDLPSTSWRRAGDDGNPGYVDLAGFCKSATTAEIAAHGHVLTPGRYVRAEEVEGDGDPFEEKMPRLVGAVARPVRRVRKVRKGHQNKPEGTGLWRVISAPTVRDSIAQGNALGLRRFFIKP